MTDGDGSRRPGRWRRRLLAVALSLALALLASEVAVRVVVGGPLAERLPLSMIRAHPTRGWEMVPGQDHYTYRHRVEVNSLGLRGPEVTPPRAGERRVLVLGDSLVYGQGVAGDATLPALLEDALRERGVDATVVNGGLRAYSTPQELALLEELGPAIAPDDVVLCWYWNDFDERDVPDTVRRLTDSGPVYFDTNSRLEGADRWRWHALQLARRSALLMWAHDTLGRRGIEPLPAQYVEDGFARLERYLQRFEVACAQLGARPWFANVPDRYAVEGAHMSRAIATRALELAAGRGLPAIDLQPPLRAATERLGRTPVIPYDGHYDAAGNRAQAEALAEALVAGKAPGGPSRDDP